jgi:hypothetical protein
MSVRGVIEYKGLHPGNTIRELKRAVKIANITTIETWHGVFLPDHFKLGAGRKYNYDGRTPAYVRRKRKHYGHTRDLEFTGFGKQQALRQIRVSGTYKGAKGRLPGTNVFNLKRSAFSPDMRRELTTVLPSEENVLVEVHRTKVAAHLNSIKSKKKVRA